MTPLYYMLKEGRRTIAKILLREGAVISATMMQHSFHPQQLPTKVLVDSVKAAGGWKPYAAKHKRVLAGLVVKCTKRPFPLDAAGLVVDFICPEGGY